MSHKVTHFGQSELQKASEDPRVRASTAAAGTRIAFAELLGMAFAGSGLNKSELADRMEVSKARVSQILDGGPHNFTIDLLGRAAGALGLTWDIALRDYWTDQTKYRLASSPIGGRWFLVGDPQLGTMRFPETRRPSMTNQAVLQMSTYSQEQSTQLAKMDNIGIRNPTSEKREAS